jgi:hypothetical protein
MFRRGALDKDMLDKVRCMEPSFVFEDLRFVKSVADDVSALGLMEADALSSVEKQEVFADFKYLEVRLKAEQSSWRRHLLALKTHDDTTQAELTDFRERAHDLRVNAINAHAEAVYQAENLSTFKLLTPFCEQALGTFAEQPPARRADDILRINMFNLPMMGQSHSRYLDEIVEIVRNECSHHPATTLCLVILPNTTKWGQGMEKCPKREEQIDAARSDVMSKLKEEVNQLVVNDVFALLRHDTMYSSNREMRAVFLMVISNTMATDGKTLAARFVSSVGWKRKALLESLPVYHRQSFQDWTKVCNPFDMGNTDVSVERKQWFSGSGFLAGLLVGVLAGMGLSASLSCHVRDWTMYDDQLALAVMELNSRSDKNLPLLSYAGGTFTEAGGVNIAENVKKAIREHLNQAGSIHT